MKFISTRGKWDVISSSTAIIKGIADDGGLYVPISFPSLYEVLKEKKGLSYEKLAYEIISNFFDDIGKDKLKEAINNAYSNKFYVKEEKGFLELYHGPTSAFKDAALLFLPQIMKAAKEDKNIKEEIVILTATSGDTGKAALQGFSNVNGFKVIVYYPKNGVSAIQQKQMTTQDGNNVKVIGIEGNFDNAQSGVKEIFGDVELKEFLKSNGFLLSSANSINIGRLIPQIVYYFYGYFELVNKQKIKEGDKINIVVPTGNFGNILAAYYSKKMGLPIEKLICSSNENNVLTDFMQTGIYDKRRELILTESPSMDILVSSNLERLIFEITNRNSEETAKLMEKLNKNGAYKISELSKKLLNDFYGNYANTEEVYNAINKVYNEKKYLIDTHTAVGYVVLEKYRKETSDYTEALVVSTASPYKFPRSICRALELDIEGKNDFELLNLLEEYTKIKIPKNLKELDKKKVLHKDVYEKKEMKQALLKFLKVNYND
ncbi:threonine synthase [Clostridium celatum]|uniref:Threonine synthase n=1 Tax=Clostridium celatum DSM 1785 TaxID=545697 RepID=L1QN91_9CLOT|nr:threonine synthase [Clostridium celatum]EKY29381.1 threonine synthase [Clostridium celatum DSM 1785]MCE9655375.1 threonine synthase [Clostridium celatum]MDU3721876.1 threonine synthase [Clostridium celatum]